MLSNHVSELVIAQWGAAQSDEVKHVLGFANGVTPHQSTIHRFFCRFPLAENQALQEQLAEAHKRIADLQKQKTPPPAFVKAEVAKAETADKKPRKKRDAKHNHGRRREKPTSIASDSVRFAGVRWAGSVVLADDRSWRLRRPTD